LYGERAGTFSMVTSSPEERERVLSQIKRVIRPLYSSPPMHGAQLVATILGTPELYKQWYVPSCCQPVRTLLNVPRKNAADQ
jgi:aspartate aminotransferase